MMMTTTPVVRARPARSPVDRGPSCCSSLALEIKWTLRSSLAPRNVEMTASEAPFLLSAGVRQDTSTDVEKTHAVDEIELLLGTLRNYLCCCVVDTSSSTCMLYVVLFSKSNLR